MYIYKITNLINNKIYIGITNNYQKRWSNHKTSKTNTAISRAIQKYGKENFKFEILEENCSLQEASNKEIQLIQELNTLIPNGYNIATGGFQGRGQIRLGAENPNACLTEEEVAYIKNHRDIPEYLLYDEFSEKISYDAFKEIYLNKTYKNIIPTVDPYPYNLEFSNQFTSANKLNYDEVCHLRQMYAEGIYWKEAYELYKDKITNDWSFWNIYTGKRYYLVMPEVFNEENQKKHKAFTKKSHSGENNGRSKLTKEDVIKIRELKEQGFSNSQIYQLYPNITPVSIRNVLNYKTWKTI